MSAEGFTVVKEGVKPFCMTASFYQKNFIAGEEEVFAAISAVIAVATCAVEATVAVAA